MPATPLFVFAFANDRADDARFLRNLPEERRRIKAALQNARDARRCEIIECANATVDELLDECQRNSGRIALLHFGGHADGKSLLFEDVHGKAAAAGAASLAAFLGGLGGLELVFLNGCSTRGQVEALLAEGVHAVVATSCAVRDDVAIEFAERFYVAVGAGASIRDAYRQASGAVRVGFADGQLEHPRSPAEVRRSDVRGVEPEDVAAEPWPWSIYGTDEATAVALLPRGSGATRSIVPWLVAAAVAVAAAAGWAFFNATDTERTGDRRPAPIETTTPAVASSSAPAPPAASSSAPAPPAPSGLPPLAPFGRGRPREAPEGGVDACAYLGFFGTACMEAYAKERDPTLRGFMRRLSDADARLAYEALRSGNHGGFAHPEAAMGCRDAGPCPPDGVAFVCLTKAEVALWSDELAESKRAHEYACRCDAEGAVIPVMGGMLACDGPNRPVQRAKDMPLDEARDIRACGECDKERGPEACRREYLRLQESQAWGVLRYLVQQHIPRCQ